MWADINGERKKVACGPCIRGHRSSKCDHRDRVLVEVRKPGRPLSSCPHPSGSCSCERVVINYTIPKTSECACPPDQARSAASNTTGRVQKNRSRKSASTLTASSLEKAIKASHDTETDASSLLTRTPTNPSFAPSEGSASNGPSPPSSASSTPRLQPHSREHSQKSDFQLAESAIAGRSIIARPSTSHSQPAVSSCCESKQTRRGTEPNVQPQVASCCSTKPKEPVAPPQQKKSCCSGKTQQEPADLFPGFGRQANNRPPFENFAPQQPYGGYQNGPVAFNMLNQGFNYAPNVPVSHPGGMPLPLPYGFNTPIYNHQAHASMFHPNNPGSMPHMHHPATHNADHNCNCGDGCSCFGCAAHPNNATMTEYIRVMHQFMSTGGFGTLPPPTYDVPAFPPHPGFGADAAQHMAFSPNPHHPSPFPQNPAAQSPFQNNMGHMMGINTNVSSPWEHPSVQTPRQAAPAADPHYFHTNFKPRDGPLSPKIEEPTASSPIVPDSPSEGKDGDTPTLSPSSYFWQEVVLPSCSDATGTCQCGDGCECVGCLTHGGHNGVTLDPVSGEQHPLPNFLSGTEFDGEGPFSEAPS
ncbi:hypothetical protein P154DRAFT_575654 [Amniculicola lignicola CBS 123094]|uniref:Copper-fist domain-containing protein n=1 Tax=Amniculicola lignicola CBS 123094 TaxID=1392246 RepID=A0A6A5WLB8_9PLEO|nr:hypothetical protein P154DRAFT_575654 [Amniculicola lignicola CBS 123094]